LGLIIYGEFDSVILSLKKIPAYIYLISLSLAISNYFLRFLKWHFYLHVLKIKVEFTESFLIFLSGLVMSITPGKFGEIIKSVILKQRFGEAISRTSPIVITERITDMISLVMISSLGVMIYNFGIYFLLLTIVVLIIGIIVLTNKKLFEIVVVKLALIKYFKKHISGLRNLNESFWSLLSLKNTALMSLFSIFAWLAECFAFYLLIIQFNSQINFYLAAFIYSIATIIGSIMFLPGGLGGTESSMMIILLNYGFANQDAVAAITTIRIVTLWFAVLVGWISLQIYQRKYSKIEFD